MPNEEHLHDRHSHSVVGSRMAGIRHGIGHVLGFGHDHDRDVSLLETGEIGIRATKISLAGLGVTAALQVTIVVVSGSVALLSDTLHNVTDAFMAIPLWIAFAVGMRQPTKRYTYGFHRAEDMAGFVIVIAIGLSAALVIWESARRLLEPRLIDHIPWVIAAGIVGALGNEMVARYRIRVGRQIGSEALIADGHHARTDSMASLAVVAAGIGAAFGAEWVDPIAGLVMSAGILWLLLKTGRTMMRRLMDGVEPELVDEARLQIEAVDGVVAVDELRVRWHGHQLRVTAAIAVDPAHTVHEGHAIAHNVEYELCEHFRASVATTIHVEPDGLADSQHSDERRANMLGG